MELAKRAYVRDNAGRFAETGGGGVEAEKPSWAPTMTREDAQHWAKDSVLKTPLTHTSGREAWEGYSYEMAGKTYANAGIMAEGLRPGTSGIFGAGVYLGAEDLDIQHGAQGSEIHDRQAREYAYGGTKETHPTHRAMVDIRNPLRVESTGSHGAERDINAALEAAGHPPLASGDYSAHVQSLGYDSMIVSTPDNFEWSSGGDQVIVYDPQRVTVISDDDYRYRKRQYVRDAQGRFAAAPGSDAAGESIGGLPADYSVSADPLQGEPDYYPNATTIEIRRQLRAALPNALISMNIGNDGLTSQVESMSAGGIADAMTRLSAQYPKVAESIVAVVVSENASDAAASTVVTTRRDPDGGTRSGIGLMFNNGNINRRSFTQERDEAARERGRPQVIGDLSSQRNWVNSIATHEFGHAIHLTAVANDLGQPLVNGTKRNDDVWYDQFPGHPLGSANSEISRALSAVERTAAPPSSYANTNAAELLAEGFTARELGERIDPTLNEVVDLMVSEANG